MATNEKQGKDTFILRSEFYPQIKLLTREQRGDLLEAIFAHATGAEVPQLDAITSMCFEFIRASMDSYASKYKDKCLSLSENGKKGGRPKKIADGLLETNCFSEEPNESKETKRFLSEANGFDETECFSEKANENKKTKNSPFSPFSPYNPLIPPIPPSEPVSENTHTVISEMKGGLGENNAAAEKSAEEVEAAKLLAWIGTNVPTIAGMSEPLIIPNMVWMLRKYRVEDIQRIIRDMHNKRAFKNMNAYTTFCNFARKDIHLKAAEPKAYTWDEVLDYVYKNRPKATTEDFVRQVVDGRPVWFKKSDLPNN